MYITDKAEQLTASISKFANFEAVDKKEIENVLTFGIKAIGILEALVDAVLEPLLQAKKELYDAQDSDKVKASLVKIATEFYDQLSEAQEMVYRFSALNQNFNTDIKPILSKYFSWEEVNKWHMIIDSTYGSRALTYEKIESLIPKIEDFVEARYYDAKDNLTFKELKDYINGIIEETRNTKKQLQAAKANFLQLSGLKGLTNITNNLISGDNARQELEKKLSKIRALVADSRTEAALKELEALCLYNYPYILKDVILYQSQINQTNRDLNTSVDTELKTLTRIHEGILNLVEEINKSKDII